MPGIDSGLGKKAEDKIKQWLDRPDEGYSITRIPDQMSGLKGSTNPCDFIFYKHPNIYWIESKSTWNDRFDFNMITDHQQSELLKYSKIAGSYGIVIVLFATYQRAFILDIRDIVESISSGLKSINITKIDKWTIPYKEIKTLPSRKTLLDYDQRDNVL